MIQVLSKLDLWHGLGSCNTSHDLACAPAFNPVWDPVLTAAKVLNGQR